MITFLVGASAAAVSFGGGATTTPTPIDTSGADLITISSGYISISAVIDNYGNTWVPRTVRGSGGAFTVLWEAVAPLCGPGHTFTVAGNGASICVAAFSLVNAFDQESAGGDQPAGNTVQPGALTPPANDYLFISFFATNNNNGVPDAAIDSGFTIAANAPAVAGTCVGSALAYLIQGAAAAENPTWTDPDTTPHISAGMVTYSPILPGTVEATIDQVAVEYATPVETEAEIDQVVVEYAASPVTGVIIDQYIIEYIPGPGSGPTPTPGPPACPPNFPVELGSGDPGCAPARLP